MIHKKIFLRLLALATMVLFGCQPKQEKQKDGRSNVLIILTDQWRAQATGYAGDPNVKTPNIDKLAKESISFTNALSVSPMCTPHRAALMTGKYPTSTGMFLNDLYLPSEELCMAEIFKAEGYDTAFLGKWHLDGHGRYNDVAPERRQGFDYWKALECSHNYNKMAYGVDLNVPVPGIDLEGLSKDDFIEAVMVERAHEFMLEGKRWFDLTRNGFEYTTQQIASSGDSRKLEFWGEEDMLWPIPRQEIDNNDLLTDADQNPGW